jgi:hypothetical protein
MQQALNALRCTTNSRFTNDTGCRASIIFVIFLFSFLRFDKNSDVIIGLAKLDKFERRRELQLAVKLTDAYF